MQAITACDLNLLDPFSTMVKGSSSYADGIVTPICSPKILAASSQTLHAQSTCMNDLSCRDCWMGV